MKPFSLLMLLASLSLVQGCQDTYTLADAQDLQPRLAEFKRTLDSFRPLPGMTTESTGHP